MADVSDNDRKDLERGVKAEKLLNDPLFIEGFENVRKAILTSIEECPMRDVEGAEKLRTMLKLLKDVKRNFERAVQDGKLAKAAIDEDNKRSLFKRFL